MDFIFKLVCWFLNIILIPWHEYCSMSCMTFDDKYLLKQRVLEFSNRSEQHIQESALSVKCNEKDEYFILYGEDVQSSVAGFGNTSDEAYDDFILNWNHHIV